MEILERQRHVHFVGTYPADSDAEAMREMLEIAGPHLLTLPSGETSSPNWIASSGGDLDQLLQHPDLRALADAEDPDPNDYLGNRWKVAVKKGHKLNPDEIKLNYSQHTHDAWPDF